MALKFGRSAYNLTNGASAKRQVSVEAAWSRPKWIGLDYASCWVKAVGQPFKTGAFVVCWIPDK